MLRCLSCPAPTVDGVQGLHSDPIVVVVDDDVVVLVVANHAKVDDANAILNLVCVGFDGLVDGLAKLHPVDCVVLLLLRSYYAKL